MTFNWVRAQDCSLGDCLEVMRHIDIIMIRESERPFETIATTRQKWEKFLTAAKAGEFDLL